MTPEEWKQEILASLDPEQMQQTDRGGHTRYDLLRLALTKAAVEDEADVPIAALIEVGKENTNSSPDWWLNFSNLFDAFVPLGQLHRLRISTFVLSHMPQSLVARAYILRMLACLGCRIDWDRRHDLDAISEVAPLAVADAMVFSFDFDRAGVLIAESLAQKRIAQNDLNQMMGRWKLRLSSVQMSKLSRSIRFGSSIEDIGGFIDKVRDGPRSFNPVIHRADA